MQADERAPRPARTDGGRTPGSATDPLLGRLLDGRYRVNGRIARGGMASVYEATDTRLDRTIAVKVMHAGLGDDDDFAARFVREARAAARLSHHNVVAVYDQGDDDGTVYLAMELVPGHTLRDTIAKESPMPPGRALALLEPVLSALASAHRAGLVHRDVKPENVLIADDGRVKVADFGLAKAVSADTQHTATKGVLIGTVSYLAPELVVEGSSDARADVYAAGVILYELLTGRKPHQGESPIQVAYRHVHHDVPPPSDLVPGLPGYVDALVARATARDRSLRPADAGVLLHQLHRVASALAEGVPEDPELTQDLTPLLVAEPFAPEAASRTPGDTAPDLWDDSELAALLAAPEEAPRTTALPVHQPEPEPAPPPLPVAARPGGGSRPRRSRRGPVLLAVALVLALAAGGGAYWFGWARYTSTPGVISMTESQAEAKLAAAGLEVDYADPAFSETVPAGQVIGTDPSAGSRIVDGGTVTVTMSKGKERYDVPRVKGMTEDQAQDALLGVKLAFDESVGRWSETVPEGTVIGSKPRAGATLRPGAAVDLIVSKGRKPIAVGRSWEGRDVEEMVAALERRGLDPQVTDEQHSDDVAEGHVISYEPSGGTLFRGDKVEITVSLGPELVEVPSVVGQGVESAQDDLEAAGFRVKVRRDDDYIGIGFVLSMDPGGGDEAPVGSTVVIYVV